MFCGSSFVVFRIACQLVLADLSISAFCVCTWPAPCLVTLLDHSDTTWSRVVTGSGGIKPVLLLTSLIRIHILNYDNNDISVT